MEKDGKEFWWSNPNKISLLLFYLLILFLPTQFGKHFWPNFASIAGLRVDYLSPTIYFTDILLILIFILSLKQTVFAIFNNYKKHFFYFLLFILFLSIGVSISKNPLSGVYGIVKFLELAYLSLFIYINSSKLDLKKVLIFFGIAVLFESAVAFVQYFNQGSLNNIFYFLGERSYSQNTPGIANASINGKLFLRPYGTFSHPNVLGGFIVLSLSLFALFMNKLNKAFLIIIFIVGTLALFLTLSRTAIFAFIFFAVSFFLLSVYEKYKKGKLKSAYLLAVPLVVIGVTLLFIIFSTNPLIQRLTHLNLNDLSLAQRTKLINASLQMIKENPIFGVGINNFLNNLPNSFSYPSLLQPAHNIFLLAFSQTGLLGFFILISILLKAAFTNKKNALFVMVIVLLGSFDHYFFTVQQGQLLFTVLLSFLYSKSNLSVKI